MREEYKEVKGTFQCSSIAGKQQTAVNFMPVKVDFTVKVIILP